MCDAPGSSFAGSYSGQPKIAAVDLWTRNSLPTRASQDPREAIPVSGMSRTCICIYDRTTANHSQPEGLTTHALGRGATWWTRDSCLVKSLFSYSRVCSFNERSLSKGLEWNPWCGALPCTHISASDNVRSPGHPTCTLVE